MKVRLAKVGLSARRRQAAELELVVQVQGPADGVSRRRGAQQIKPMKGLIWTSVVVKKDAHMKIVLNMLKSSEDEINQVARVLTAMLVQEQTAGTAIAPSHPEAKLVWIEAIRPEMY